MADGQAGGESGVGLKRQLGLFDSAMIMVGLVIGSGIFVTTGIMAKSLPSAGLILLVWLFGGLLTLAGALTYAELGAAMPEAGGQYVYLREAYGPLPAFLFGWLLLTVYMTAGIAGLAVIFAEYVGYLVPALAIDNVVVSIPLGAYFHQISAGQLLAAAAIAILTLVNYLGLVFGKTIQNIFTVAKVAAIGVLIVFGLSIGRGSPPQLSLATPGLDTGALVTGFGLALVAVIWAFDGWNNINFVASEIRNPRRTLPRVLILGTVGITTIYVLANYVYFWALPVEEMVGVVRVAEIAAEALFGGIAAALISIAVIVSVFGSLNASILTGPRVYYAMARDGLFFKRVAGIHPRFRTPATALFVQALLSILYALSGTFEQILTFAMFVSVMFWIAAASAVFTLRRSRPEMERPYRAWGYPVVPALFILASAGILLNTLLERPLESLAGVALTAAGIPVYLIWCKRH